MPSSGSTGGPFERGRAVAARGDPPRGRGRPHDRPPPARFLPLFPLSRRPGRVADGRALEEACGNPVLTALLAQTRVFTPRERVERTLERLDSAEFGAEDRYLQHRRLVQALRAHDSAAAEALAQHHVATALAGLRARRD
ncbi:FCD domain-containing protein [Streptomyces sp. NPDC088182]|uniref:FCD domain-containing protein n=1 Tax=Streptomyces sp. NPDC088182 TaxID=3365838 RepID=UPI0037FC4765